MSLTIVKPDKMNIGTVITQKGKTRTYVTVKSVEWKPSPSYPNGAWHHLLKRATAEEVAEAVKRDVIEDVMED